MEGHIRGDEDEFVLLDEMGGGREAASSPTTDKNENALVETRRQHNQKHLLPSRHFRF